MLRLCLLVLITAKMAAESVVKRNIAVGPSKNG